MKSCAPQFASHILVGRPDWFVSNCTKLSASGKIDQQQLYPLHKYAHCICVLAILYMKSETLFLVVHIPSFRSSISEITAAVGPKPFLQSQNRNFSLVTSNHLYFLLITACTPCKLSLFKYFSATGVHHLLVQAALIVSNCTVC